MRNKYGHLTTPCGDSSESIGRLDFTNEIVFIRESLLSGLAFEKGLDVFSWVGLPRHVDKLDLLLTLYFRFELETSSVDICCRGRGSSEA